VKGKIDYNPEGGNSECRSSSGVLDTLKVQDGKQKCDCENVLVIVDNKSPKRPKDSQ